MKGEPITTLFDTSQENLAALIRKINDSINETNNQVFAAWIGLLNQVGALDLARYLERERGDTR